MRIPVVAVLVAAACGDDLRPEEPRRSLTVAAGDAAELNLELPALGAVELAFTAGAPLAWDIHSHPDGEVVIHAEGIDDGASLPFTADTAGIYSYLWENTGAAPVSLEVEWSLPPGGRVHSWYPP